MVDVVKLEYIVSYKSLGGNIQCIKVLTRNGIRFNTNIEGKTEFESGPSLIYYIERERNYIKFIYEEDDD